MNVELWAGINSLIEARILQRLQNVAPLIGLSDDNFITAGKILSEMRKKYRLESKIRRTLTWDILIALSAQENKAIVVTDNIKDFRLIQRFAEFSFVEP